MKVDYSRFSCGGLHGKHVVAIWKGKTGTIPAFAIVPRKTKKNLRFNIKVQLQPQETLVHVPGTCNRIAVDLQRQPHGYCTLLWLLTGCQVLLITNHTHRAQGQRSFSTIFDWASTSFLHFEKTN
jgi:hypothetical protein